ncbi:MAG: D-alanyl-D-alanine carboxypeptidase family protein [bacterium]
MLKVIGHRSFNVVVTILAATLLIVAMSGHFVSVDESSVEAATRTTAEFDFSSVKKGPSLNLKSAILVNYDNGEVLYSKGADRVRAIASISKLVTAMVVIDKCPDLQQTQTISKSDARRSSRSRLPVGTKMTLLDLLHSSLMCSDNRAARSLARATAGSIDKFAELMNAKARELGLEHAGFVEPSGLDQRNVATAHEVAKIIQHAYDYPLIAKISAKKSHTARLLNTKSKKLQMTNTNRLIWSKYWVLAGKTGYTQAADYCLTSLVKNKEGERLTLVVLGVPGDKLRFKEARRLLDWGFRSL